VAASLFIIPPLQSLLLISTEHARISHKGTTENFTRKNSLIEKEQLTASQGTAKEGTANCLTRNCLLLHREEHNTEEAFSPSYDLAPPPPTVPYPPIQTVSSTGDTKED
jgi:hypothetical protein